MIPLFKVHMPESVIEPLKKTLFSGYIGQGPRVEQFEAALAPWVGSDHVVALNSGTSAIHLALRLSNVGPGDEVISTPMTCTATNEPILERGAKIVWADIDPCTGEIDPGSVSRAMTVKTKAVVAVHWAGYPCDLASLSKICRSNEVKLIEDAAHAFGAEYQRQPIGSHSDFVCFSFQAIKHLTTGDGGALVCKRQEDYERGKLLRWFGINREQKDRDLQCLEDIPEHGYKFQMNDIAATIGLEQLKHVGDVLYQARCHADTYYDSLSGLPRCTPRNKPLESLEMPSPLFFPLLVDHPAAFIRTLRMYGIEASQVHGRNDTYSMFREFKTELPGVDAFCRHHVAIPCGWWLTPALQNWIVQSIRDVCK